MKKLPRYPGCFVCGRSNRAGTDVTFLRTDTGVECEYRADPRHQSYEGILHGGIISALLDECMGWAVVVSQRRMYVTGELTVRYLKPIGINTTVKVEAFVDGNQNHGKKYCASQGLVRDYQGTVYARAEGKFFPIPHEYEERVLEYLRYDDDPEKCVTMQDISEIAPVIGQ